MKKSAGILLFRTNNSLFEVLLVHPGGPFWKNKDDHAWSVPKGEMEETEDPFVAARREFREETGFDAEGNFIELAPIKQRGGKIVYCWALEGAIDPSCIKSNTFEMEWPPNSSKYEEFPEIDKAEWLSLDQARLKIIKGQLPLIDQLEAILKS